MTRFVALLVALPGLGHASEEIDSSTHSSSTTSGAPSTITTSSVSQDTVSCGIHSARTCAECPSHNAHRLHGGNITAMCDGDCMWYGRDHDCVPRFEVDSCADVYHVVSCGSHVASSCACCTTTGNGECGGDCSQIQDVCSATTITTTTTHTGTTSTSGTTLPHEGVWCGHDDLFVATCSECPNIDAHAQVGGDLGALCSGDCAWAGQDHACVDKTLLDNCTNDLSTVIRCGSYMSSSCTCCLITGDHDCAGECSMWGGNCLQTASIPTTITPETTTTITPETTTTIIPETTIAPVATHAPQEHGNGTDQGSKMATVSAAWRACYSFAVALALTISSHW